MRAKVGRTSFDCRTVARAVKGRTKSIHSASFTLTVKIISRANKNISRFS